jgi:hypothetical protein
VGALDRINKLMTDYHLSQGDALALIAGYGDTVSDWLKSPSIPGSLPPSMDEFLDELEAAVAPQVASQVIEATEALPSVNVQLNATPGPVTPSPEQGPCDVPDVVIALTESDIQQASAAALGVCKSEGDLGLALFETEAPLGDLGVVKFSVRAGHPSNYVSCGAYKPDGTVLCKTRPAHGVKDVRGDYQLAWGKSRALVRVVMKEEQAT